MKKKKAPLPDGKKKKAKLTYFFICQDYNPDHWNWTAKEKAAVRNMDCRRTAEIIRERLERGGIEVAELHAITHDKDERKLWNDYDMMFEYRPSGKHIHILVRFKAKCGGTRERLAEMTGVGVDFIAKPRPGKYGYDNCLSYLIHIKYPGKYQYKTRDVVTVVGRPYTDYFNDRYESWMKGRAVRQTKDVNEILMVILERIENDPDFTEEDMALDDDYIRTYIRHQKRIQSAFEAKERIYAMRDKALNPDLY